MAARYYSFKYRINAPPYDKTMEVLEAFFTSYPGGDYTRELREKYKLEFRRGAWRRKITSLGTLVPDRLVKGRFNQWPVIVRVMVRPAPAVSIIAIEYRLYMPSSTRSLGAKVQASVDAHIRNELTDLAAYLAQCTGARQPAEVVSQ